ncbi:MAG: protease modulator HflC [Planctomycetota bacterium]|jgi:membrane protease subunit HflC
MKATSAAIILIVVVVLILTKSTIYVIPEGQQAVITQFGKPVRAVTEAGPYLRIPFVQEVNRLEKRLLPWDGEPQDMPTKDKRRIFIDVWARWRIVDPMNFFITVRTEQRGQQRLDELVDSSVRALIAKNKLIDAVRTTDDPLQYESEELEKDWSARRERVTTGRLKIEKEIKEIASEDLRETYGMELVEIHIKRINYIKSVREKVYERMRSERMRIASLYESEAKEEENRILGRTRKELDDIEGDMLKRSAEIRGEADAKVIEITAKAFGKSPKFYEFLRQLEAYKKTLGQGTRLVLSTENEFLRQLHGSGGKAAD